jgi:predicted nucleic acid-binding protein
MGIMDTFRGERIYLDTNIFIFALEAYPEYVSALTSLFAAIDDGKIKAVTSELTLAEVLIKPMMDNNADLQKVYKETLRSSEVFSARLRAESETLRLPDAIHLATARVHHCTFFLTNDKRRGTLPDFQIVILSEPDI